jgi:hypothetical protein
MDGDVTLNIYTVCLQLWISTVCLFATVEKKAKAEGIKVSR